MASPEQATTDFIPKSQLDNPQIRNARNPSEFGYHHGPIYPNGMLDPDAATPVNENGAVIKQKMSKTHGGICWLTVDGDQMCGQPFDDSSSLYRHMRKEHTMHMDNLQIGGRGNIKPTEIAAGEKALKRYVLEQKWFNASFVREPGKGPINNVIHRAADGMQELARFDREFAEAWGTRFHRPGVQRRAGGPSGNRFGGSPTAATPPSAPNRRDRRVREIAAGGVSSFQARLQEADANEFGPDEVAEDLERAAEQEEEGDESDE